MIDDENMECGIDEEGYEMDDKMLIDGGDEALGLLDLCLQIGGILAR